jgi:hypothetical protein
MFGSNMVIRLPFYIAIIHNLFIINSLESIPAPGEH